MPDAIVLVGLSGSGKSSVGKALAERLARPFIDLDALIEDRTGRTPGAIIETDGEARFRVIESNAVAAACAVPGAVVATGGGAVIDPLNRWALWGAGTAVWLDAADEVLIDRLAQDATLRPIIGTDAAASLARLRTAREPFYRAADIHIDSGGPLDAVTDAVANAVSGPRRPARAAAVRCTRGPRPPAGATHGAHPAGAGHGRGGRSHRRWRPFPRACRWSWPTRWRPRHSPG